METLTKQFEQPIANFLRRTHLTSSGFSERAIGYREFCGDLRRGRSPTLGTAHRVLGIMHSLDATSSDEVGRAVTVAYEAGTAQADPLDPTTKYFLNRFIADFHSGRRATVEEQWARSLRFLSTELANAAFVRDGATAAGTADTEFQVEQVVLRIHPAPEAPHGATADFDLVHLRDGREILRERWWLTLRFTFLDAIPSELVVYNPMGLLITYLQANRALVTEAPA